MINVNGINSITHNSGTNLQTIPLYTECEQPRSSTATFHPDCTAHVYAYTWLNNRADARAPSRFSRGVTQRGERASPAHGRQILRPINGTGYFITYARAAVHASDRPLQRRAAGPIKYASRLVFYLPADRAIMPLCTRTSAALYMRGDISAGEQVCAVRAMCVYDEGYRGRLCFIILGSHNRGLMARIGAYKSWKMCGLGGGSGRVCEGGYLISRWHPGRTAQLNFFG